MNFHKVISFGINGDLITSIYNLDETIKIRMKNIEKMQIFLSYHNVSDHFHPYNKKGIGPCRKLPKQVAAFVQAGRFPHHMSIGFPATHSIKEMMRLRKWDGRFI